MEVIAQAARRVIGFKEPAVDVGLEAGERKRRTSITKAGPTALRWCLVQAVTVKQMLVVIRAKKESGFIASLINQNSNIIK